MSSSEGILDLAIKNVVFVGAGFVGGPSAAVLASKIQHLDVTVVDVNPDRIGAWNSDNLPVAEPGLHNIVRAHRIQNKELELEECDFFPTGSNHVAGSTHNRKNLRFSSDVQKFVGQADMIFLCVDTPQRTTFDAYQGAPDLTNLTKAVKMIGAVAMKDFVLVEKSTVPAGTSIVIQNILQETLRSDINFEILSNPEFLAEGTAIQDLWSPSRILIGSSGTKTGLYAAKLLSDLYVHWVLQERIITSDIWSSELSKLCANALLAQRISSINSFSMICERLGADVREISKIAASDPRIGSSMLSASIGFGGSCFPKDIAHLVYLANSLDLPDVARYWNSVLQINQLRKQTFADRVCVRMRKHYTQRRHRIAILGYAFKAETNDARESPAIDLVKRLSQEYDLSIYDPCVPESVIKQNIGDESMARGLADRGSTTVCSNAYSACEGASAICILTDWNEFKYTGRRSKSHKSDPLGLTGQSPDSGLGSSSEEEVEMSAKRMDWHRISKLVQEPKLLFDGRNVVDDSIAGLGFEVQRIGNMSAVLPTSRIYIERIKKVAE